MKLASKKNVSAGGLRRGFTVVELMVALSIGLLVSSAAVYLMVQAFAISETMVRDYYLQFYGRLLREKIVRSVDGHNGLRVSIWDSFWIQYLPGNDPAKPDHVATISYEYLDMTSDYKPEDADVKTVSITRHIDEVTQTFKKEKNVSKNDKFISIFKDPITVTAMDHVLVPRNDLTRVPRHLLSTFTFEVKLGGVNYYPTYVIKTTVVNDEQN